MESWPAFEAELKLLVYETEKLCLEFIIHEWIQVINSGWLYVVLLLTLNELLLLSYSPGRQTLKDYTTLENINTSGSIKPLKKKNGVWFNFHWSSWLRMIPTYLAIMNRDARLGWTWGKFNPIRSNIKFSDPDSEERNPISIWQKHPNPGWIESNSGFSVCPIRLPINVIICSFFRFSSQNIYCSLEKQS